MMKNRVIFMVAAAFFLWQGASLAQSDQTCTPDLLNEYPGKALPCYLAEPESPSQVLVVDSYFDRKYEVMVKTYQFESQIWPKTWMSAHSAVWRHILVMYIPKEIDTNNALLFVNGGIKNNNGKLNSASSQLALSFKKLAAVTHSVVIDLQDVPNQYLTLDDGVSRKEDGIVAYTWNRYLQDPGQNAYWPLHLPMTKAVIKAMDVAQDIVKKEREGAQIEYFMLAGASKRGWATWLAAAYDQRVQAIVPIVIDAPQIKEVINLIHNSYDNTWPAAFYDYIDQHTVDRVSTPEFAKLMQALDPMTHLTKQRAHISKYIIRASGDDFFVPDALNLYYGKLSGEKLIRVIPNQRHYISPKLIERNLFVYYGMWVEHEKMPHVVWKANAQGEIVEVMTDQFPVQIRLWEAVNPKARDFRLSSGIEFTSTQLAVKCTNRRSCKANVKATPPVTGWKASFVEVTFHKYDEEFVVTTPVSVVYSVKPS